MVKLKANMHMFLHHLCIHAHWKGRSQRSIEQLSMHDGRKNYGCPSSFPETILLKRQFLFVKDKEKPGTRSALSSCNILTAK